MYIYVVRHAWADDRDPSRWPDDAERPLTNEGRSRFKKVASVLVQRGFAPERIATSPLVRCRQTADILRAALPKSTTLDELDALAPGSDLKALMAWSRQTDNIDVAWVGHSPDVEELTAALIGDGSAGICFKKGAVAAIRFENQSSGHGELEWLLTAKSLGL
jgi:phosphohistidine phosphatase